MKKFLREFKSVNSGMPNSTKIIYGIIGVFILFNLLNNIRYKPNILINIGILLLSVILHEIAHGVAAYINGDSTAKNMGRFTLNPIKHLDPMGTILPIVLILSGASFVIGWAKPVPVNFNKIKNKKWGIFQVAIAGVTVNFMLAFIGATLIKAILLFQVEAGVAHLFIDSLHYLIQINLILGIFNLIPIPPLDGSKVVFTFGCKEIKNMIYSMERYGIYIIVALLYFDGLTYIISPVYRVMTELLVMYIKV